MPHPPIGTVRYLKCYVETFKVWLSSNLSLEFWFFSMGSIFSIREDIVQLNSRKYVFLTIVNF